MVSVTPGDMIVFGAIAVALVAVPTALAYAAFRLAKLDRPADPLEPPSRRPARTRSPRRPDSARRGGPPAHRRFGR